MKAIWNNKIIAQSDATQMVEGNHYFPPESVNKNYLMTSSKTSTCPWKGKANYYSLSVAGKTNVDAAWYYPETSTAASKIKNYIAFWRGVDIVA